MGILKRMELLNGWCLILKISMKARLRGMVLVGVLLEMMKKISGQLISMRVIQRGYFYCLVIINLLIQMNMLDW